MTSSSRGLSIGSRTTAYVVAGLVATVPVWVVLSILMGPGVGTGAVIVSWAVGIVWLAKKRQEDPGWDETPPARR